jgi:hypothetical protein
MGKDLRKHSVILKNVGITSRVSAGDCFWEVAGSGWKGAEGLLSEGMSA